MKTVLSILVTFGCLNAYAGGSVPELCSLIDKAEVILKEGQVLDRGGHPVKYRIVMEAKRCHRKAVIEIFRNLFLHYDTPVQRSENDGLAVLEKADWFQPADKIFNNSRLNSDEDGVTKSGLRFPIGGVVEDNSLPLTAIPKEFFGNEGTVITFFGNAFPTHYIQGPFTK